MNKETKLLKQKVFGLYIGQEILSDDLFGEKNMLLYGDIIDNLIESSYLLVTPLPQITDEDEIKLGDIIDNINTEYFLSSLVSDETYYINGSNYIEAIDFLRSRGYALPAFGKSVEELIELGIFKLK